MKIRNIRTGGIIGMVMLGMHWAAGGDHKEMVERLIDKGADVNARDEAGWTPLHYAAFSGHKDVAELLIAKGADVNTKNDSGETPLHIAEHNVHKDVADLLKKHGARKGKCGGEGQAIASLPDERHAITAKSSLTMKDEGRRE
jgi:ankyrin repeat protein